jgi:hypothetical protein
VRARQPDHGAEALAAVEGRCVAGVSPRPARTGCLPELGLFCLSARGDARERPQQARSGSTVSEDDGKRCEEIEQIRWIYDRR